MAVEMHAFTYSTAARELQAEDAVEDAAEGDSHPLSDSQVITEPLLLHNIEQCVRLFFSLAHVTSQKTYNVSEYNNDTKLCDEHVRGSS